MTELIIERHQRQKVSSTISHFWRRTTSIVKNTVNVFNLLVETLLANTVNIEDRSLEGDWIDIQPPFPHETQQVKLQPLKADREFQQRISKQISRTAAEGI